jgi:outer membrane protein assembly factor BamE (lipoprotein component of BamABCDE complex)
MFVKVFLLLMFLVSCATNVTHGVMLPENNISAIIPNITRREDVRNLLGSPSFIVEERWHYATTVKRYRAFFLPKVLKHDIYIISFQGEVVSNVEHVAESDIQKEKVPTLKIKTKKPDLKKIYNAN